MLGLWDYSKSTSDQKYGDDDLTYQKGMEFLSDCKTVEDWGCGTGHAKRFCKGSYVGVDGSMGPETLVVSDLREYTSNVEGIFLRHVLEHNHDWKKILGNAVKSFTHKMALILFTPFSHETHQIATNWSNIPDLSFRKEDIAEFFAGLKVREEALRTQTQYKMEYIFYIEKPANGL